MTKYLLGANVFMEAKDRHYGFDFCPGFWDWLVQQNRIGKVASIENVAHELYRGKGRLEKWAKARGESFFHKPDNDVITKFKDVSNWANDSNKYEQKAIAEFLGVADSMLVAHALAFDFVVVTHEVASNSPKNIKIPNACKCLSLRFKSSYEMLRQEGAKFVLQSVAGPA